MTGISYEDFVDTQYRPDDSDLVCQFAIEPAADLDILDAAGRVASESSNGTWATLEVDAEVTDLSAIAFDIQSHGEELGERGSSRIRVAYPEALFEPGNMAQILSCIAGNIMGMKAVESIRLLDCEWPEGLATSFPGPQFGSAVRSELLDAGDRPALATVPKPKVGLRPDQHAQVGYDAWTGGVDLLKDDENLTNQSFNRFEERVKRAFEQRDRAEAETGERKDYLVNVTGETDEMKRRADLVAEQGGGFIMVDVITTGWAAVQTIREHASDLGLAIHAHRAMHAAFDRLEHHGVSMRVLAQVARLVGVDHIHTGTANLGKLENEDTEGINAWLTGDLYGLADVLPVASGGLHPGIVEPLLDALGTDIMVQAGGGIHGHPDGTNAGARALRAATKAYQEGVDVEQRSEEVPELAAALEAWGTEGPR
ncbi:MAG: type III ribulose-bisphosphate carboxylase [Halodesulfurarchaeum sp.]